MSPARRRSANRRRHVTCSRLVVRCRSLVRLDEPHVDGDLDVAPDERVGDAGVAGFRRDVAV